ncbi:MAG: nucleotidyltransferase domain-containing protein [Nanoarchaeota archaeon]
MIEKNNTWRVLEYFFTYPLRETHLRELSREMKLSMPAILAAISKLKKEDLIIIAKTKAWTKVKPNLENEEFKWLKRSNNLERLYSSGLVKSLSEQFNFHSLVCFGSYSRGEDLESSDIDLALTGCSEKSIELNKFEKSLKRKISLHFVRLDKVSEEFRANLYNGIVVKGAL